MKRKARIPTRLAILASAVLLLAGCPLVSDHPLADPEAASIDPSLLGTWSIESEGEKGSVSFLAFDEHELVCFAREEKTGRVEAFRAFATEIRGERFLNAKELGGGAGGWYILNYRVEGPKLRMRLVDDELLGGAKLESSEALGNFVEAHLADPKLYAAREGKGGFDMVWTRSED